MTPKKEAVPDVRGRQDGVLDLFTAAIRLSGHQMKDRTFVLGDQGGFVLYLPVEQNVHDRTLESSKWFGASGFGRKYLEGIRVWVHVGGHDVLLNRTDQQRFEQFEDHAARIFLVNGMEVRQSFFVPNRRGAFVMEIACDQASHVTVEPEFDMRYYQAFNHTFDEYAATVTRSTTGARLDVTNQVEGPSSQIGKLQFFASVESAGPQVLAELLPPEQQFRDKTYLKDQHRAQRIVESYSFTHQNSSTSPDEAPLWDQYRNTVFAPGRLRGPSPLRTVFSFSDRSLKETERDARSESRRTTEATERARKETVLTAQERSGGLKTGNGAVDVAYRQVLARFNDVLVARDITVRTSVHDIHHFFAIFAGNKYFLDAWKRDENISLEGLLETNDLATVRAILRETWQYQDPRTGRLPHIIRLGEPLVYYSSDGTLWALQRLLEYTRRSGDLSLLDEKYHMVEHFFRASLAFVKDGLLPSGGIIDPEYRWETWEDTPFTPRDGYPVEIEMLWLTVVAGYLPYVRDRSPHLAVRLEETLEAGRESFPRFYLDGYLADSLDYGGEPRQILTPNGHIAFGLDFPLPPELAHSMVVLARTQLAGKVGIRSLAIRDWDSVLGPDFASNPGSDPMASVGLFNYHRGVEWLWLNPFFVAGELAHGSTDIAYWAYVHGAVHSTLYQGGIGGLSELYDNRGPLGADFQAWSMAGFLAGLHRFAGVEIDAPARKVTIRPAVPGDWPFLETVERVGDTTFGLRCERGAPGTQRVSLTIGQETGVNYRASIGVRIPAIHGEISVMLDGRPVTSGDITVVPGCGGVDAEVWIETDLTESTVDFVVDS